MQDAPGALETLRWYIDAGVDEFIGETPVDWFARQATPAPTRVRDAPPPVNRDPPPPVVPAASSQPVSRPAVEVVQAASLAELQQLVEAFDGCALKATATRTVFGVGNAGARLMLIGEAPGAEEDRQGIPFVGASGQLLDRMLAAIGLARDEVYITNTLYWRPPGNRTPTPAEGMACLPFLLRQIELVGPEVLVLVGSPAVKLLLGRTEGVMRLRGQWFAYESPGLAKPLPTRATFHPAFLLRSPGRKREAWRDLLAIREKLDASETKLAPAGSSD